jgi:tRNA pseudouridine55 synthase
VSAIKINGERAYAKVRGGDEVKLAARPITVSRFELLGEPRRVTVDGHDFIDLDAIVDCSSGTYIRALARDLGAALQVGGHLTALRRTRIGGYNISDAVGIDALNPDELNILPSRDAARAQFDSRELTAQEVIDLRHGKRLTLGAITESAAARDRTIAAFGPSGALVAMLTKSGGQLKSVVVFQEETDD